MQANPMRRRLIHAFLALTLPVLPVFAQSGSSGATRTSAETITGSLRSISGTELVLDTGDEQPIRVQIPNTTKYLSTMGKVKASDFEPGDHVTVDANHDGDHYVSTAITMNKKGTAEDKAKAREVRDASAGSNTSA